LLDRRGRLEAKPADNLRVPRRIVEQRLDCLLLVTPGPTPARPLQRASERALGPDLEINVDA
jgi:hypothetical protein